MLDVFLCSVVSFNFIPVHLRILAGGQKQNAFWLTLVKKIGDIFLGERFVQRVYYYGLCLELKPLAQFLIIMSAEVLDFATLA